MAIGIACAGTGLKEAIELLEPLIEDRTDFVRQGAYIGLSLVLIQQTEGQNKKVTEIRKKIDEGWTGKQEILSKFGAILASGIIDAGGRNCTINLHRGGHNKMRTIVGLAIFSQYWYWHPYLHFLTLSFEPSCVIGLTKSLKMPIYSFKSNAKPSMFGYSKPTKKPEKKRS